ncbi:MAG: hypothetical protein IT168_29400 [Bryobacterales bacterium]|nr:hypothetical protein [Bryobacterales bacterium]
MRERLLLILAVLLVRLPFLNHPIQGDDAYYLAVAQHAQIEPLHPTHFRHLSAGIDVDMRGYPHPPLNGVYLGALLASFREVREATFHLAYLPFSIVAVLAAYSMARRMSSRPMWATLLFIATPAFLINGTSFESDLPHLASFLTALALFESDRLVLSALCMILASLTAYQAVVLTPILAWRLFAKRTPLGAKWLVILTPVLTIAGYQCFERLSTGAMPAAVLTGYFQNYNLQSITNKIRNFAALTTHLGWMAPPLLAPISWIAIPAAALAAWFDSSPLFWIPFGLGVATLYNSRRNSWILIFFGSALVIFFAGSARYLLPIALPVAVLAVERFAKRTWLLALGFGTHLALGLALAAANYQHWDGYRRVIASIADQIETKRTWVNAEWGLRFYAESHGAMPMHRGEALRAGDLLIDSKLAFFPTDYRTGGGQLTVLERHTIRPSIPLRILSMDSCSAYSSAQNGLCAFGISDKPADEVTISTVTARMPELSYLPMSAPQAESQLLSGVYGLEGGSWRWTGSRIAALLKAPAKPLPIAVTFRIVDQSPARLITLSANGETLATQSYPGPGLYTLQSQRPFAPAGSAPVTVTVVADKTFQAPGDNRELALILTGIGFVQP